MSAGATPSPARVAAPQGTIPIGPEAGACAAPTSEATFGAATVSRGRAPAPLEGAVAEGGEAESPAGTAAPGPGPSTRPGAAAAGGPA